MPAVQPQHAKAAGLSQETLRFFRGDFDAIQEGRGIFGATLPPVVAAAAGV